MAGLEELALLLAGQSAQKEIAAENPYFQFQAVPDQIGSLVTQAALQAPGRFSTRDILLSSLASGLGSGLLGGIGKDYQNTLTDRYQDAVNSFALGGSPTEESSNLPSSLFGQAKQRANLFKKISGLKDREAAREYSSQRSGKIQDALLAQGKVVGEGGEIIDLAVLNPAEQARALERAKVQGTAEGYGLSPSESPDSPQYKINKEKEDKLLDLRTKLEASQPFKDYEAVEKGYRSVLKAVKDPSSVSDQELVRGAIQAIEPGLSVREGEQNAVANSQSIPNAWKGALNNALTGGTKLDNTVRQGILRIVQRRYDEHARTFDIRRDFAIDEATRLGLPSPESVSSRDKSMNREEIEKEISSQLPSYSILELEAAGYTENDIATLRAQGQVK